ncbi:MAG: NAD(P)-dependent oxidoreductase [Candidatus Brocadiia bacterium]
MSILVVGGKEGFIGNAFIERFTRTEDIKYTALNVPLNPDCRRLDLNKPADFDYSFISPDDFVAHLAAISLPDVCEQQYEMAYRINVTGTAYFIRKCLERRARVLFFSSDTVYGESQNQVDENSLANPHGRYAQMKNEIERQFLPEKQFKVFRMSYIFSKADKMTTYLQKCSQTKQTAEIYHPVSRNVIYLNDLLDAIIALKNNWDKLKNPVFNICGDNLVSKLDITEIYKRVVDNSLQMKIAEPGKEFYRARPKIINLKSLYLEKLLGRRPISLAEAMKQEFNK